MGWLRRMEVAVFPLWLAGPLLMLGLTYVVGMPLGLTDEWGFYVLALVLAAGLGWFMNRRYYMTVLERAEGRTTIRIARRMLK